MRSKAVCCEVAELESRGHESLPGSHVVGATAGAEFFQPLRRPAKDDQWQRDGFPMLMGVPWDTGGLTVESMTGSRRKHVTESLIQDEAPGGPVHLEVSLRATTKR